MKLSLHFLGVQGLDYKFNDLSLPWQVKRTGLKKQNKVDPLIIFVIKQVFINFGVPHTYVCYVYIATR